MIQPNIHIRVFQSDIAKLTTDSMFKLQHDGIDRGKGKDAAPTITKIVQIQGKSPIVDLS